MLGQIKAPDVFAAPRYKEEQITSVVSKVGTFIACSLLCALSIVQLMKYGKAESSISPSTIPRNSSLEMSIPATAVIIFAEGKEFYDPSVMRILFQYRVIYYGNAKRDEEEFKPQTYVIPSQTCKAFYELEVYEDKSITTRRLLNETEVGGGKTAVNGCPDFDAADKVLKKAREEGVKGVREGGHIQGKYGEPMYYWMQVRVQACPNYGPKEGIECKNESYVSDLFEKGVTLDFVTLDRLSPDSFTWGNIYVTLDKTRWSGYEIFMKPIVHIEEDKNLPSVYYPVSSTFGKLDYWDVRSEPRFDPSDSFLTLYVRMSGLINKNYVKYYSLEDALTKIGSWERILWMIVGTICIYYNLKSVSKEEENVVMSAPFVMDETNADQVMDVEEAQERLAAINPNTHQAKLLRRALSTRSAGRRASLTSNKSSASAGKAHSILNHAKPQETVNSTEPNKQRSEWRQQQQLKGMLPNPDLCDGESDGYASMSNSAAIANAGSPKGKGSPILKHRSHLPSAEPVHLIKNVYHAEAGQNSTNGTSQAAISADGAHKAYHQSPVDYVAYSANGNAGLGQDATLQYPAARLYGAGGGGMAPYRAPDCDVGNKAPLQNYISPSNGGALQGFGGAGQVAIEQREVLHRVLASQGAVHMSTAPAAGHHGVVSPGMQAAAYLGGGGIAGGRAVDERFTDAEGGSHQWA